MIETCRRKADTELTTGIFVTGSSPSLDLIRAFIDLIINVILASHGGIIDSG